jgi:hypothetical protein
MSPGELAAAVELAAFRCVECGSSDVWVDSAPAGLVPVVTHWPADGADCPAAQGGLAQLRASLDLLDCLAAILAPYGGYSYGEPVWHRRIRLGAAP